MGKKTGFKKITNQTGYKNTTNIDNNTIDTRNALLEYLDMELNSQPVEKIEPEFKEGSSSRKKQKTKKAQTGSNTTVETITEDFSEDFFWDEPAAEGFALENFFNQTPILKEFVLGLDEKPFGKSEAKSESKNELPQNSINSIVENTEESKEFVALEDAIEKKEFKEESDKELNEEINEEINGKLNGLEKDVMEGNESNHDELKQSEPKQDESRNESLSASAPRDVSDISEKRPLFDKAPESKLEPAGESQNISGAFEASVEKPLNQKTSDASSETKQESEVARAFKEPFLEANYDPTEFASIQAMGSLKGFAPLGMLFILMDILNGEEGLIRVNRLANSLKIGKPAMLAQLDHLEQAGLIRTVSSSQRGRHVELLVPNPLAGRQPKENLQDTSPVEVLDILPPGVPKNFTLEKLKALQKYLTERGIRLTSLPDESRLNPRLSEIAAFLGKYLSYVQPFYSRLKGTLNTAEEIHFSLLGFQGRDVTHTLNLCKMLREVGFLVNYAYRRSPQYKIITRLKRTPAAINFLSGGWLEHYIRDRVVAILNTHPSTLETSYAFMKNPKIILPGDENFEFDFLLMVTDKVFWIEAKTGEYMDYIAKYSRVSKLLGLNRNSSLLVLVDVPKPDANISARYGLSCCSVDEFPEVFRLALTRELVRSNKR